MLAESRDALDLVVEEERNTAAGKMENSFQSQKCPGKENYRESGMTDTDPIAEGENQRTKRLRAAEARRTAGKNAQRVQAGDGPRLLVPKHDIHSPPDGKANPPMMRRTSVGNDQQHKCDDKDTNWNVSMVNVPQGQPPVDNSQAHTKAAEDTGKEYKTTRFLRAVATAESSIPNEREHKPQVTSMDCAGDPKISAIGKSDGSGAGRLKFEPDSPETESKEIEVPSASRVNDSASHETQEECAHNGNHEELKSLKALGSDGGGCRPSGEHRPVAFQGSLHNELLTTKKGTDKKHESSDEASAPIGKEGMTANSESMVPKSQGEFAGPAKEGKIALADGAKAQTIPTEGHVYNKGKGGEDLSVTTNDTAS